MKELENFINVTLPTIDGWCTQSKAECLAGIILATRPEFAIELGTFGGRSALPIALAMKHVGRGTLIGVDPYLPEESAKNENSVNKDWWSRLDHNAILEKFKNHIARLGLQDIVRIERMTSDAYEPKPGVGLLHIDGSHGEQVLKDVKRYCPCVKLGGFVIMDDIHWVSDQRMAVMEAIHWMEENGFVNVFEVLKRSTVPHVPDDDWGVWQLQSVVKLKDEPIRATIPEPPDSAEIHTDSGATQHNPAGI